MKRKSLISSLILLLAVLGAAAFAFRGEIREALYEASRPEIPEATPYVPEDELDPPASAEEEEAEPEQTPPPSAPPLTGEGEAGEGTVKAGVNLAVPFIVQAPHANWDMPYQEACEEASLIMAAGYFAGEQTISADEADRRILALVAWEEETFGYYEDTTAIETARMAREYFGLEAEVKPIGSMEDAKREIDAGRIVVLPASGKLLGNPNFRNGGPLYHMLVVKGYTKDGLIITNDPGTRRGADYVYDPTVLYTAIHDWNGGDVQNGAKVMIVISP